MIKKLGIFVLPAVFFLFVFVNDCWRMAGTGLFILSDGLREWFVGIGLLCIVLSTALVRREKDQDLFLNLRRWARDVIVLSAAMLVLKGKLPFFPDVETVVRFNQMISRWILFLIAVLVFHRMVSVFRTLIFIQQKKHTKRNFLLLFLLIGMHLVFVLLSPAQTKNVGIWPSGSTFRHLSLSFLLLFACINGLRTHWIHFLNKRQKVKTLLFGMAVTPFSILLMIRLPAVLAQYGEVAGAFATCMTWMNTIVSGFVLVALWSHLPSAGILDRRMTEIQSLQNLSAAMGSVFDLKKLFPKIAELSLQLVDADSVWVETRTGETFELAASCQAHPKTTMQFPDPVRQNIRETVLSKDRPVLMNDLPHDKRLKVLPEWTKKTGSLLAVVIRCQNQTAGILYALKTEAFGFLEESGGLFQAFADQAAISIENARLVQLSIEQERYREELKLAHDAQRRLLPQKMPAAPGLELEGFSLTANDIGGDFYDAFEVHPDRIDVVVGDVSGHGAFAAFYMAELHGSIRTIARHFSSPKQIVREINAFLIQHKDPENFVTMLYAIYQPSKRRIRFVRAGHQPVGYLSKKGFCWLEPKGLGLGMAAWEKLGHSLQEKSMVLNPGDTLFFYTDGLIEVRNEQGKEFDEATLSKDIIGLKGKSAKDMLAGILRRVEQFSKGQPRSDDMTAVVLRVREK